MAVNRWIVTTTINSPTDAIRKYDALADWNLLVVGDRRTPEYKLDRGVYLDWKYQKAEYPNLCSLVGSDNTQRGRMIAFIEAHRRGAELVATIDDDCNPYPGWPGEIYVGRPDIPCVFYECNDPVFNPFAGLFEHPPRGFPPQIRNGIYHSSLRAISPLIQENFWDGEADIDACWRVHGSKDERCGCKEPFASAALSPVNTQNTIIHGSVLKDHCGELPFVGHVGDVWAGYLFQAHHPCATIYAPATVRHWQDRTLDSVLKDLEEELFSYKHSLSFVEGLRRLGPDGISQLLPGKTVDAIKIYRSYFE